MLKRAVIPMAVVGMLGSPAVAQEALTTGVKTLAPAGAIKPTGTWGLATRAGDFLFIAGIAALIQRATISLSVARPASAKPSSTCS